MTVALKPGQTNLHDLDGVTVYIAGPMRNHKFYNFPAFEDCATRLREAGMTCFSPAEEELKEFPHHDPYTLPDDHDWSTKENHFTKEETRKVIMRDVHLTVQSDGIVLLPGWHKSTGAMAELGVAIWARKRVFIYHFGGVEPYSDSGSWLEEVEDPSLMRVCFPVVKKAYADFVEIMKQAVMLHCAKGHDYGSNEDPYSNIRSSEDFGTAAWIGAFWRGNDKMVRIKNFIKKGKLKFESAEDAMIDLLVYTGIGLKLFRETKPTVEEVLQELADISQEIQPEMYQRANARDLDKVECSSLLKLSRKALKRSPHWQSDESEEQKAASNEDEAIIDIIDSRDGSIIQLVITKVTENGRVYLGFTMPSHIQVLRRDAKNYHERMKQILNEATERGDPV